MVNYSKIWKTNLNLFKPVKYKHYLREVELRFVKFLKKLFIIQK